MHSPVILIVRADSQEQAISEAEQFLECHDNLFDYYSFGGRFAFDLEAQQLRTSTVDASIGHTNVRPLGDVYDLVVKSTLDYKALAKSFLKRALEPKNLLEFIFPSRRLDRIARSFEAGALLIDSGNLLRGHFALGVFYNCNVYNTYMGDYTIPDLDTVDSFYAVLLDIHS